MNEIEINKSPETCQTFCYDEEVIERVQPTCRYSRGRTNFQGPFRCNTFKNRLRANTGTGTMCVRCSKYFGNDHRYCFSSSSLLAEYGVGGL